MQGYQLPKDKITAPNKEEIEETVAVLREPSSMLTGTRRGDLEGTP
jgi:hypothetical protein